MLPLLLPYFSELSLELLIPLMKFYLHSKLQNPGYITLKRGCTTVPGVQGCIYIRGQGGVRSYRGCTICTCVCTPLSSYACTPNLQPYWRCTPYPRRACATPANELVSAYLVVSYVCILLPLIEKPGFRTTATLL